MIRRPPRSTRTDTLVPDTTLFRSKDASMIATNPTRRAAPAIPSRKHWRACHLRRLVCAVLGRVRWRSEEHTSELQSLMRISYAVFCLKKKKYQQNLQLRALHDCTHKR